MGWARHRLAPTDLPSFVLCPLPMEMTDKRSEAREVSRLP